MRSIETLREWSHWLDCAYATSDGLSYQVYSAPLSKGMKSCGLLMREKCDEIEAEIAERYMELPLDADGVPIRPREEVSTGMGDNGPIGHLEYWYPNHWVAVIEYKPGQFTRYDPAAIRHVKPRTLEDVLQNLIDAAAEIHAHALDDDMPDMLDALIGEYADRVREAVGE